jgi:hypothetical protein
LTPSLKIKEVASVDECKFVMNKNSLSDCMSYDLLADRKFPDVTIKINDKSIKAHKIILANASWRLRHMMLKDENLKVLAIDDLDFEVFEEMLNFIYEDEVINMEKHATSLLEAANQVIKKTTI